LENRRKVVLSDGDLTLGTLVFRFPCFFFFFLVPWPSSISFGGLGAQPARFWGWPLAAVPGGFLWLNNGPFFVGQGKLIRLGREAGVQRLIGGPEIFFAGKISEKTMGAGQQQILGNPVSWPDSFHSVGPCQFGQPAGLYIREALQASQLFCTVFNGPPHAVAIFLGGNWPDCYL